MFSSKNYLLSSLEIALYFLPFSFVLGSSIVNLNLIIFILLATIYLLIEKIKINFNLSNLSLAIFFFIIIFSSYINIDTIGIENFLKSIFLLKFFLFYILIEVLLFERKINTRVFFNICLFLSVLISLDLSLQFFYGKNILGYEPLYGRITGIFGEEAIAGSFIQKIFIFSFTALFFFLYPLRKNSSLIFSSIIFLIIFASFIANNRIAFFLLISFVLITIFTLKTFRKNLIAVLFFMLPLFYYFYHNDTQINRKFVGFFSMSQAIISNLGDNVSKKVDRVNNETINDYKPKIKKMTNHEKLYYTSLKSFEENILIGNGHKSFRFKCQKFTKINNNFLCSTHPHNYHLEVIHNTGIIGLFFLSMFVFSILFKNFRKLFSKDLEKKDKLILTLIMINFLLIIFPLKSTGSLFTTWNGALLWLSVSFVNYARTKNI